MIDEILGHDVVARLVGCLFDSLWQGALIALAAAALRLVLPRSAPVRYWLAVGALVAMLAVPVASFVAGAPPVVARLSMLHVETGDGTPALLAKSSPSSSAGGASAALSQAGGASLSSPGAASSSPPGAASSSSPAAASAASMPFDWPRFIAFAWLAGVLVCLLRLFVGWTGARTLLSGPRVAVPASLERMFEELCRTLDVRGCVRLVIGEGGGAPAVVGWLKPVVWLPLAAVTGLTPEQLRVVLAHELAHIRRCDFAVNVLQRCIEALLFYHPAVWIVSATIRAEREHCCDDAALAVCGDRLVYAGALVELEAARAGAPRLAMAATGGNLARRVRRVLGRDAYRRDWRDVIAVCAVTGTLLALAVWQSPRVAAQAPDRSPGTIAPGAQAAPPVAPPIATQGNPEAAPEAAPGSAPAAAAPEPQEAPELQEAPEPQEVQEPQEAQERPEPQEPLEAQAPQAAPPVAPVPPNAAVPPRPARPPRARNDAPFDASYFGLERPWALFHGDRTMFGGTNDDRRTASALHDSLGRDLLWFRDNGIAYMITDEATLNRVLALFAPIEELGQKQRELGEQQRQLGEQQRELGDQQRQIGEHMRAAAVQLPDLGPQLADLRESMAKLELGPNASPQDAAQLQAALASVQRQIGRLQGEIGRRQGEAAREMGRQQGELGRRQGELGRRQGELGRQQGELGRQQGELARKAQRELDDLLREAVRSGLAQRPSSSNDDTP